MDFWKIRIRKNNNSKRGSWQLPGEELQSWEEHYWKPRWRVKGQTSPGKDMGGWKYRMMLHSSLWPEKSQNTSASNTKDRLGYFLSALLMKSMIPSFNWKKKSTIKSINEVLSCRTPAASLLMALHPAFRGKHCQWLNFYGNNSANGGQNEKSPDGTRSILDDSIFLHFEWVAL